ncbi:MAG: tRNA (guanosine(37)-N1)-methyltransferase TrmD [Desulfovibrio sp.]|nr:tRNA (guanosine(37)-N1)-methyltransferase TrmD [Desulfovibrio sp.]
MLSFQILSLFPEFFASPLDCGLLKRARESGLLSFSFVNPRDFSHERHHHVDDSPYGGGPGMVMQVGPIVEAIRSLAKPGRLLFMSPSGRPFTQRFAQKLAHEETITILSARYEGVDRRVLDLFPFEEVSLTDAVLNSGDSAALCVIEAVSRLVPGFMGKEESGQEESFTDNLLEYPHYTRPECFEGKEVPEVLLSGNHERIAAWRRTRQLRKTREVRPDLLAKARLSRDDCLFLAQEDCVLPGRLLSFCLVHHPVKIDRKIAGTSSLTNLDIHDIARVSASYGLGPFYVVQPLTDQRELLQTLLRHWLQGPAHRTHPDRAHALRSVTPCTSLEEAIAFCTTYYGMRPFVLASSANWPKKKNVPLLASHDVRVLLDKGPVLFCLGTAQGLADEAVEQCDYLVRPLRFLEYNHLSVRSACAIYADRILGDFS